jgi:hypothetical protein
MTDPESPSNDPSGDCSGFFVPDAGEKEIGAM